MASDHDNESSEDKSTDIEQETEDPADPDPEHTEPVRTQRSSQEVLPESEREAAKARSEAEDVYDKD